MKEEQIRALDYLRRRGTEADPVVLRRSVGEALARLEAGLSGVPEAFRRQRAALPGWTIHEVVDHLVESHRPAVEELRQLIHGHSPSGDPIPAGLTSADPFARSWDELVGELHRVHAAFLAVLAEAADAPVDDTAGSAATAPVVLVVKAATDQGLTPITWIERLDWKAYAQALRVHTLEHIAQVERLASALEDTLR